MAGTVSPQMRRAIDRGVRVRGNTDPDPSWQNVGMYKGRVVYVEIVPNMKRVPRKDPVTGDLVYQVNPKTGVREKQLFAFVQDGEKPMIEREFQLQDLGNGIVRKNYHFRDSEEEIQRAAAEASRPTFEEMQAEIGQLRELVNSVMKMGAPDEAVVAPPEVPKRRSKGGVKATKSSGGS